MAKATKKFEAPVYNVFRVISNKVGKDLGGVKVTERGYHRVVAMTEKQAKFYIDQGVIER